ncbi:response regulator [Maribacter sp. 2307ULW6-5]|uniref:response regulator n=1 Tax=Maribacter sp. 2307ULW6-5 TaxID=3386275 RepID=UPI0039BD4D13
MSMYESCCVIDDDAFFFFNTKRLMQKSGFCDNILHYSNGQEAIDALVGLIIEDIALPQVILLDLNMPKKNGWEFLKEYKALPQSKRKHTQLYIISSFSSPSGMAKAQEYEGIVDDYITKPLTEEKLMQIAKKAVQ